MSLERIGEGIKYVAGAFGHVATHRAALTELHVVKLALACGLIAWLPASWAADRYRSRRWRLALDILLVLLTILSVFAYFDFGNYPKFHGFRNPHDLFHYYLGSKYSREVGYFDLYPAVVVATTEGERACRHRAIRRMEDYGFVGPQDVLKEADKYKRGFTPERWEEFKHDTLFFEKLLGSRYWTCVQDMGYNATPVWNMVGRFITNRIDLEGPNSLAPLVALDLLLLAAMSVLVAWAFGWRAALIGLVFFCTHFCMSYTHIRGGFLRLDWVTLLVMTICMLKKSRYKTAGVLLGYAAMARIFPLIFGFGMGARCLWAIYRNCRAGFVPAKAGAESFRTNNVGGNKSRPTYWIERAYLEFFLALGVTCAILMTLSIIDDRGLAGWKGFENKIAVHDSHIAPVRVGFRYVFIGSHTKPAGGWTAYKNAKLQFLEDHSIAWWAIQALVLLVSLFAVRNLDDYESLAYGYVPAYFLTAPTFYYQIMMMVPLYLFLPKRDRLPRTLGLVAMVSFSAVMLFLNQFLPLDVQLSYIMSCLLLAFAVSLAVYANCVRAEAIPQPAEGEFPAKEQQEDRLTTPRSEQKRKKRRK